MVKRLLSIGYRRTTEKENELSTTNDDRLVRRISSSYAIVSVSVLILMFIGCSNADFKLNGSRGSSSTSVPSLEATPINAHKSIPAIDVQMWPNIVLVVSNEPRELDVWSPSCNINSIASLCEDLTSDSLTWIDAQTLMLVPGSGTKSWEQMAPDRWRFVLREGVRFHNGEPYDAEAAKAAIDSYGDLSIGMLSETYVGGLTGHIVNDLTIDIACDNPCASLPRNTTFLHFQAPRWYESAPEVERARATIGFGPYKLSDWQVEAHIKLEAYEDYVPVPGAFEMQKPFVEQVTLLNQVDPKKRIAMLHSQLANWVSDIGIDRIDEVPTFKVGTTGEILGLVLDTIWHPELKKTEVRQALAHSIDCQLIVDVLYEGLTSCRGNLAVPETIGFTLRNSAKHAFDPELSRVLLQQSSYDSGNEIVYYAVSNLDQDKIDIPSIIQGFMTDVGFNVRVEEVDINRWLDLRNTGPGHYKIGSLDALSPELSPSINRSTHMYQDLLPIGALDYGITAVQTLSCRSITSKVCQPVGLEPKIDMMSTVSGENRTILLEELATIAHDQAYYVPLFDKITIYGLDRNLSWQPRLDGRIRMNTMSFFR